MAAGPENESRFIPANALEREGIYSNPALREGLADPVADDQVVHQPDIDQRQGLLQPAGNLLVGQAGLRHAGRVVMGDDDRSCVAGQGLFDDLPGVDVGRVQRAPEQLVERDDPAAVVEPQAAKDLVGEVAQAHLQEFPRCLGVVQRQPRPQRLLVVPAGQFQRGLQDDVPRRAQPARLAETLASLPSAILSGSRIRRAAAGRRRVRCARARRCAAGSPATLPR